ncbi:hypothetical protein PAHAL_5G374400 [Panicum hallii]|uniref:Uncharacterized protein n=1 Tax=Panicum hallii TaxID=206008 RepID=A0A2T8IMH0_9POAL|nr:hypothetical protein PAHAL_5G374400 [Panicum hallii]
MGSHQLVSKQDYSTRSLWTSTRSSHLPSSSSSSRESTRKCPATWKTTSAASTTSRCLSPSRRPCGAQLFMYLFYASATLEPILDSVVIK